MIESDMVQNGPLLIYYHTEDSHFSAQLDMPFCSPADSSSFVYSMSGINKNWEHQRSQNLDRKICSYQKVSRITVSYPLSDSTLRS